MRLFQIEFSIGILQSNNIFQILFCTSKSFQKARNENLIGFRNICETYCIESNFGIASLGVENYICIYSEYISILRNQSPSHHERLIFCIPEKDTKFGCFYLQDIQITYWQCMIKKMTKTQYENYLAKLQGMNTSHT